MTAEVNAAIEGAFEAGASEVVVNDSHDDMRNISIESLDPRAVMISGGGKRMSMMEGLDNSFDAMFLIGYHARMGTDNAVLNHTWTGFVQELSINHQQFGETELNAGLAGYYKVPVALLTGDSEVIEQAGWVVSNGEKVIVKYGVGRYAGKCIHPDVAREKIRTAAASAVLKIDQLHPFVVEPPVEVKLTFDRTAQADLASIMPGVVKTGPMSVVYSAGDYHTAYRAFMAMVRLAGS
jgi:D-amino peptidase